MSDEEDKGGVVIGGISFGVSSGAKTAVEGEAERNQREAAPRAAGGPIELGDVLLPLRVAVIADLVPRAEHNAGADPPDHPIRVAPCDLDPLLARLAPRLAIEVESVLSEGRKVRVDFAPRSLKDFRPDGLAASIPLLRSLLDGRRVLERLRDGTLDVDGARAELGRLWSGSPFVDTVLGGVEQRRPAVATPTPSPEPAEDRAVANILDMVGLGTAPAEGGADADEQPAGPAPVTAPAAGPGKGRFDAFIAAVAFGGQGKRPGADPSAAIAAVERAFGLQLGAIVQHPELRRLERAWRGLELCVNRAPKTGVMLEVTSAREDDFAAALARAIEHNTAISPPVSFAVVDTVIGPDAASLARLRAVAEVAEANAVPVLANACAALFGCSSLDEVDRLDNKQALFDAPERVPWRSEAHRPAMLWVSLALNRVLSRQGYDRRTSRIREAAIEEQPKGPEATVWLEPAWAIATLALRSFGRYEWPCGITGARNGGIVDNLPVHELQLRGGETVALPLEAFFSTETQRALGRIGLTALASQPNSDEAYLLSAATAYVPPPKKTYDTGDNPDAELRLPQASLSDQLFVARLAQFLGSLGGKIGAHEAPADIEKFLEAALWELFKNAPPSGPEIAVTVEDGPRVSVTVRPRRFLGVGMEEITLGVPLA